MSGVFLSIPRYDLCAPLSHPSSCMLMNHGPSQQSSKEEYKLWMQRPCYQRGSPCQDPAGNWTTRKPSDDRKKTQTAVVWSCFPFIRSGQNHLARHSERGRRQGRQRKRWKDNIREWTGLDFCRSQRAVGNREKCRKLVAKSSVVPQRPSLLRDR